MPLHSFISLPPPQILSVLETYQGLMSGFTVLNLYNTILLFTSICTMSDSYLQL
uniref:Uncharacterized protein n=1 Tax=Anguilla anguilla TaxID=7936 RepID=A0A0E9V9L5_ANGAN